MSLAEYDSQPPGSSDPSAPKSDRKFDFLLVKIFSLKQTKNKIFPSTIEKITFRTLCNPGIFRTVVDPET